MTTFALNNLWTYIKGLPLSQSDREWLANKLISFKESTAEAASEAHKAHFLRLAGSWSDAEGEEHYQMMKRRDEGRPVHRSVKLED